MNVLLKHGDRENSHNTSVVTSHVDHVDGLGIFSVSQISSLGQNVVNLFFLSFWRNEGRLFLRCLPVHRVECCVALWHHPMFHFVTSFVSLVECVSAHIITLHAFPRPAPSSALKSPPVKGKHLLQFSMCFSIVLYMFFVVARVGETYTHQFDALAVDHDCGGEGIH